MLAKTKFILTVFVSIVLSGCVLVTTETPAFTLSQIISAKRDMHIIDGNSLKRIDGDSHIIYVERMKEFIKSHGLDVVVMSEMSKHIDDGSTLWGYYDKQGKKILLNTDISPNAQFATLVHEFGHHLQPMDYTNMDGQVFAEAVSYFVCQGVGLDVEQSSQEYMSGFNYDYVLTHYSRNIAVASAYVLKGIR